MELRHELPRHTLSCIVHEIIRLTDGIRGRHQHALVGASRVCI
jgi:hypothetical protein